MFTDPRKSGLPKCISAVGISLLIALSSVAACSQPPSAPRSAPVTLTVSAAADLTSAFQEIGVGFEKESGIKTAFNFSSSGQLAQQIRQGAPVDVFASAGESFVDNLEKNGLIIPGTKMLYARGRITLWPREGAPFYPQDIRDLARDEVKRVAIANPETAPYGMAAKQALQSAGEWEAVQPKLVTGENISQTFQYARTGNVDVAIVSLSLAIESGNSHWVLIPEGLHQPINQALGIVKATTHEKEARLFVAYVNSSHGKDILRKYGFIIPGEAGK